MSECWNTAPIIFYFNFSLLESEKETTVQEDTQQGGEEDDWDEELSCSILARPSRLSLSRRKSSTSSTPVKKKSDAFVNSESSPLPAAAATTGNENPVGQASESADPPANEIPVGQASESAAATTDNENPVGQASESADPPANELPVGQASKSAAAAPAKRRPVVPPKKQQAVTATEEAFNKNKEMLQRYENELSSMVKKNYRLKKVIMKLKMFFFFTNQKLSKDDQGRIMKKISALQAKEDLLKRTISLEKAEREEEERENEERNRELLRRQKVQEQVEGEMVRLFGYNWTTWSSSPPILRST